MPGSVKEGHEQERWGRDHENDQIMEVLEYVHGGLQTLHLREPKVSVLG